MQKAVKGFLHRFLFFGSNDFNANEKALETSRYFPITTCQCTNFLYFSISCVYTKFANSLDSDE